MKTGLALGSGGARGLGHIGVLQALEKLNIPIDYIAGSSMGAFIGALYASTMSLDPLYKLIESTDWKTVARIFFPSFSREGLSSGNKIVELLEDIIPVRAFDELKIPLAIDTTDLYSGNTFTITSGNLIDAVRASIAIPLLFTPVRIENRLLGDGGLLSPVPIQSVRNIGADKVIAVNVLAHSNGWFRNEDSEQRKDESEQNSHLLWGLFHPEKEKPKSNSGGSSKRRSVLRIGAQTTGIGIAHMAKMQIQLEHPDILLEPDTSEINVYDFHRGDVIIEKTYQQTLKDLQKVLISNSL